MVQKRKNIEFETKRDPKISFCNEDEKMALLTEAVDKLLQKATSAPSFGRNLKKMI